MQTKSARKKAAPGPHTRAQLRGLTQEYAERAAAGLMDVLTTQQPQPEFEQLPIPMQTQQQPPLDDLDQHISQLQQLRQLVPQNTGEQHPLQAGVSQQHSTSMPQLSTLVDADGNRVSACLCLLSV